jgi:hypothetical protein
LLLRPEANFGSWTGHFCQSPHVAMRYGLYHHRRSERPGARRSVSEGSSATRADFPADYLHRTDCHFRTNR